MALCRLIRLQERLIGGFIEETIIMALSRLITLLKSFKGGFWNLHEGKHKNGFILLNKAPRGFKRRFSGIYIKETIKIAISRIKRLLKRFKCGFWNLNIGIHKNR